MYFDIIVIGAGAAGMMAAAQGGQRGRSVLLIDHSVKRAEKIRISGGGRCNFTNLDVRPENYLSSNPKFVRAALSRFSSHDFVSLVKKAHIPYHEKTLGQLFCDRSAQDIIDLLQDLCAEGNVKWAQPLAVESVQAIAADANPAQSNPHGARFVVNTTQGSLLCQSIIIATGGLTVPKIGATDFGYRIAKQFGHHIIEPRPALVPLTFAPEWLSIYAELSGLSIPVLARCSMDTNKSSKAKSTPEFAESLLFTHRGLSGPTALQVSSYWQMAGRQQAIEINLLPQLNIVEWVQCHRRSKQTLTTLLSEYWPKRLAQTWCEAQGWLRPLVEMSNQEIEQLTHRLRRWQLHPSGTLGFDKAEVTLGGVDTDELDQRTLESRRTPGLFFVGEVVDVTGWLGGYNFQWAWSSGFCAGQTA